MLIFTSEIEWHTVGILHGGVIKANVGKQMAIIVMDIGISILIYITYVVSNYS
jgi:hypothetical protein